MSYFRPSDILRGFVVISLIFLLASPIVIRNSEERYMRNMRKRIDDANIARKERANHLSSLSYDERFILALQRMDLGNDLILDYVISDKDDLIYICVPHEILESQDATVSCIKLRGDIENFAMACLIEKEIRIAGISNNGMIFWEIGATGEIKTFDYLRDEGGDAYEL